MRVIAGSAGGLRLQVPETDVRPTMDRVKAAIFSSLGERVIDARVLDLFAGTGGLGIEALSRGAVSVLFVDEKREAVQAIEENLRRTKLDGRVRRAEVFAFLKTFSPDECFDLIFADPPYEAKQGGGGFTRALLQNEQLVRLLVPGGTFVLEKRPTEKLPPHPFWEIMRQR